MTVQEYNNSVEEYSDGLFRFILSNIRDEETARDIVQDTYEKLWIRVETVTYSKVKSYIFTAGYHTMIDRLRKDKRMTEWDNSSIEKHGHSDQYSDLNEVLHEAIGRLPEDQKSVILLRDYEGYSYKEISEITGLSEAQVKVYIYRGRMFLRNYIGKLESIV